MTRIDFHTHVGDRLGYACRLARKAYVAGQSLVVVAAPPALHAFDEKLWTFAPLEFIPHCLSTDAQAAQTPIVLAERVEDAPAFAVLMNLSDQVPENFARFERLLEVVGDDPADVAAARERYRFYRDRGYPMNNFKRDA